MVRQPRHRPAGRGVARRDHQPGFASWLDEVAPGGRPVVLVGFSGGAAAAGGLASTIRSASQVQRSSTAHAVRGGPSTPARSRSPAPVFVARGDRSGHPLDLTSAPRPARPATGHANHQPPRRWPPRPDPATLPGTESLACWVSRMLAGGVPQPGQQPRCSLSAGWRIPRRRGRGATRFGRCPASIRATRRSAATGWAGDPISRVVCMPIAMAPA